MSRTIISQIRVLSAIQYEPCEVLNLDSFCFLRSSGYKFKVRDELCDLAKLESFYTFVNTLCCYQAA